jgi:hypothetical protein
MEQRDLEIALAEAKREAREELRRILAEEASERAGEKQDALSRPATASPSQS